jgi:hypothetical protein
MTSMRHTIVFVLVMTLLMGLVLSAWFTWQAQGFFAGFAAEWAARFVSTYIVVVPTVVLVTPLAQAIAGQANRLIDRLSPKPLKPNPEQPHVRR